MYNKAIADKKVTFWDCITETFYGLWNMCFGPIPKVGEEYYLSTYPDTQCKIVKVEGSIVMYQFLSPLDDAPILVLEKHYKSFNMLYIKMKQQQ
jgi:hypothetical protein